MSKLSAALIASAGNAAGEPSWLGVYRPEKYHSAFSMENISVSVNSSGQMALGTAHPFNGFFQIGVVEPDGTLSKSKSYNVGIQDHHRATFDPSDRLIIACKGSYQKCAFVRLNSDFNSIDTRFDRRLAFTQSGFGYTQDSGYGCESLISVNNNEAVMIYGATWFYPYGTTSLNCVVKIDYNGQTTGNIGAPSGPSGTAVVYANNGTVYAATDTDKSMATYSLSTGNSTVINPFSSPNRSGSYWTAFANSNSNSSEIFLCNRYAAYWKFNTATNAVTGGKSFTINGTAVERADQFLCDDSGNIYICGRITISNMRHIFIIKGNSAETVFEAKLIRVGTSTIFTYVEAVIKEDRLYLASGVGSVYRDRAFILNTTTMDIDGNYNLLGVPLVISTATLVTTNNPNNTASNLGGYGVTNTSQDKTVDGNGAIANTSQIIDMTEI